MADTSGEVDRDPARPLSPALRAAGLLVPGIHRVHDQVGPYAAEWRRRNRAALADGGPVWVAVGDSMTQSVGAGSVDGGWVGQLHRTLAAEGLALPVVNLSATGARALDAVGQVAALGALPVRVALVTVLVGANDMFPPRRQPAAVPAVERLLAGLPAGRSVVATLPRRNRAARAVNARIDAAAERGDVEVADLRGRISLTSVWGTLAEDRFHPNERGYARIAERFADPVRKVLTR